MKLARLGGAVLLALPGVLAVWLSFNGGGFFAGTFSLTAALLCVALILRVTLAERPFAGLGGAALLGLALLAVFAGWTLVSSSWSDSPARALMEFQRALAYVLAFMVFASIPHTDERLAWMLRGLAAGIVVVCAAGLTTRVLPEVWPIGPNVSADRLSYPLTYWNALGVMAACGALLCVHLTSDAREPLLSRALAAAALPVVGSTLLFTFSRGAIGAGAGALVAYFALARPRGAPGALLAALVPTAIAVKVSYDADLLQTAGPITSAAVSQGHDVALAVGLAALIAGVLRVAVGPIDARLAAWRAPQLSPWAGAAIATGVVIVVAGLAAVSGAGSMVADRYHGFVDGGRVDDDAGVRARLADPASNGRIDHWRVAMDAYRSEPTHGTGAGTYELEWARERPYRFAVVDGHSLYVEVLGELGIVGLLLIAGAILTLLAVLLARALARSPARPARAAVFAVVACWAIHAGIDWDWEMPAVTLPVLALGAYGIAAQRGSRRIAWAPSVAPRVAIALALLLVLVTPVRTVLSQRQLDRAITDLKANDCQAGVDHALSAVSALSVRPEPWQILGFCDLRLGNSALARRALEAAVERDPHNWDFRYSLALVEGAAGRDPRRQAAIALRLNPRDPRTRAAAADFAPGNRREWRARAARAPLPLP